MFKLFLTLIFVSGYSWSAEQLSSRYSRHTSRYTCPKGQDYFQQDLHALSIPDPNNKDPKARSHSLNAKIIQLGTIEKNLIAKECSDAAFDSVTAGKAKKKDEQYRTNRFFRCNLSGQPLDHQEEPCLSPEYKNLVVNSLDLTTKCLKEFVSDSQDLNEQNTWAEGYFKMLSTESGLQINVVSQLNENPALAAVGITQLRAKFIIDFLQRTLPRLRKFLARPETSTACKTIGTELLTPERIQKLYKIVDIQDPTTQEIKKQYELSVCSNIDINDGQPLLNLIIGFANLKLYKESTFDSLMEDPKYASAFKDLSPAEMLDLKIKIVSWSYNVGSTRLRNHLKKVIDEKYAGRTVPSVRNFIETADFEERRNYVFALEDRYKRIIKNRKTCRTDQTK